MDDAMDQPDHGRCHETDNNKREAATEYGSPAGDVFPGIEWHHEAYGRTDRGESEKERQR